MHDHPDGTADDQHGDAGTPLAEQEGVARVSEGLKQAFAALGPAEIPMEDKGRWQQRLIAITNAAKHDLATAERRLDAWWEAWEAEVGPRRPT